MSLRCQFFDHSGEMLGEEPGLACVQLYLRHGLWGTNRKKSEADDSLRVSSLLSHLVRGQKFKLHFQKLGIYQLCLRTLQSPFGLPLLRCPGGGGREPGHARSKGESTGPVRES